MDVSTRIVLFTFAGQIVGGALALLLYYAWSHFFD